MLWPNCVATPRKLAFIVAQFVGGVGMFGYGLYKSHENVAPLQAEIRARNEFVRKRLREKYGPPPED